MTDAGKAAAFAFRRPVEGVGYVEIPDSGGFSCVFVVGPPGRALLVDCYTAATAPGVIATLEGANYGPRSISAIAVTHGHLDHFGGAAQLAAWSGAPVWAHPAAAVAIEDHWGGYIQPAAPGSHAAFRDWDSFRSLAGGEVRVERMLREGDRIESGGTTLDVLHLAGHERGEIGLFEPERRGLFCGDFVQGGMDAAGNWLGLIEDVASQRRNLARVRALKPDWLFKCHRVPRTGADVDADLASAAGRLDAIERAVLDALRGRSTRTTAELVRAAFKGVLGTAIAEPPNYAIVTVTAFLLDLAQRGLARRTAELEWTADGAR